MWVWGAMLATNEPTEYIYGPDIYSFMEWCSEHTSVIYFHNLKFDGYFILHWLLDNEYEWIAESRGLREGQMSGLISDSNKFYSLRVKWPGGHTTEFRDSLKKIPMTVKRVAEAFNLPVRKGEIDYHAERPVGYVANGDELQYLQNDLEIVARAIAQVLASGMKSLTVASDSLNEYKHLITKKTFFKTFPILDNDMDTEIRRALRGGFTLADKRYKGSRQGVGLVLDVNSLYPHVMATRDIPYGEPKYFDGAPPPNTDRHVYIMSITFTANLKPNHIPCIQIKNSGAFGDVEYLENISEPVTVSMTNVDFALYQDHYDMNVLSYNGGWLFRSAVGLFADYINKWATVKANATGGQREIAKLHLNSLYGKMGSNPDVTGKVPYLDEHNTVRMRRGVQSSRPPVYTAAAVFITSYGREMTIRAAQMSYSVFAYADTDSLHLLTDTPPAHLDTDPHRMGAWKLEYHFEKAFYVRPKMYLERLSTGEMHVAWAGMPADVASSLTFDDLQDGRVFHGKLSPKSVPGGVVLSDVPYTLKL